MEAQDLLVIVGFVLWSSLTRVLGEAVTVQTTLGKIEGFRRRDDYGLDKTTTTVDRFFGIPFAEPPVGKLRYENPLPVRPWRGTLRATKRSAICWQYQSSFYSIVKLPYKMDMGDDCLYLNIFSPYEVTSPNTTYPVMVYIHGGSNMVGSGNYFDGHVLAQFGVVVVTMNFRLGPIGYLTTGDERFPGNRAFYDQLLALRWVQIHIARFRGEPDRVTLFGNSAGGWNVGFHMLSPLSKGLFHAAVVQSGSVLMDWAMKTKHEVRQFFDQLATDVHCNTNSVEERIRCLKDTDPLELCEMGMAYFGNYPDGDALPGRVIDLIKEGKVVNKVPVMIGVTAYEWLRFSSSRHLPTNWSGSMVENRNLAKFMISLYSLKFSARILDVINYVYKDWSDRYNQTKNVLRAFQAAGDMHMTSPSIKLASELDRLGIPTRFYFFDHPVKMNIPDPDLKEMRWIGNYSYHETELPPLFGVPFTQENLISVWHDGNYSDEDRRVSRQMMTMWTNFAKCLDPTPHQSINKSVPVEYDWKPFKPATTDYFHISRHKLVTKQHLRAREVALWNRLVPELLASENITDLQWIDISFDNDSTSTYMTISWVLAGVNVLLFIIGVILIIVICRLRRRRRKPPCSAGKNGKKEEAYGLQNTNAHV